MSVFVSPSTGVHIRAVLFDTFGSVVDWRTGVASAVARFADAHGEQLDPFAFADAWRSKYEPAMEEVRSTARPFVPLDVLHRENLGATLDGFGLDARKFSPDALEDLNRSWERVQPWPDSVAGLTLLKSGYIVGPLSNGSVAMLTRMAKYAGLSWDVILGTDLTGHYKPQPEAYLRVARILGLEPGEVMLAAAHNYDLAAARDIGLATGFIQRPTEFGPGQTKDLAPEQEWDVSASSILALAGTMLA